MSDDQAHELARRARELVRVGRWRVLGRPLVSYSCTVHGQLFVGLLGELGELAAAEVRAHLAEHHLAELAELGAGPCQRCGELTDHLRARDHLGGDSYVCERHAPAAGLSRLLGLGRPA